MTATRVAWLGHRSAELGGGMATYSHETVAGLRRRGMAVTFFTHDLPAGGAPASPGEVVELSSHRLMKPIVLQGRRARRTLVERLSGREFDLVHASFWFSSLDFDLPRACREARVPLVATFHVAFDHRVSVWGGVTNATYRLYAPVLARCDRVIIFSEAQMSVLAALGVSEERMLILPNGVDIEHYSPGPSDWKERLGGARRLFVYMGRVDTEKNVDALLRAFLAEDPPEDVKLAIVGHGTERRKLQRQFRDPRVLFTGHLADADDRVGILRAADVFVLPSQVEGLSLSMLEAMACGTAVVVTDVGGDGSAVRGAGIVINPDNLAEELGLAVRLLLDHPWLAEELGRLSRARAVERFSLDRNLDRLAQLYSEVRAS